MWLFHSTSRREPSFMNYSDNGYLHRRGRSLCSLDLPPCWPSHKAASSAASKAVYWLTNSSLIHSSDQLLWSSCINLSRVWASPLLIGPNPFFARYLITWNTMGTLLWSFNWCENLIQCCLLWIVVQGVSLWGVSHLDLSVSSVPERFRILQCSLDHSNKDSFLFHCHFPFRQQWVKAHFTRVMLITRTFHLLRGKLYRCNIAPCCSA